MEFFSPLSLDAFEKKYRITSIDIYPSKAQIYMSTLKCKHCPWIFINYYNLLYIINAETVFKKYV